MKLNKISLRLSGLIMTFVLIIGMSGLSALGADESDYVAEFRIVTDKASYSQGEAVAVDVKLKTNYYIYAMQIAVIYDGDALEMQNTSATSNKAFLTFRGQLAESYMTNGNWKSPGNYYTSRNSNIDFWSQASVMDKYKIAFASWSADSSLSDGCTVMLEEEETIVSFELKATRDIENVEELIFMSEDFLKTQDFKGGLWFCGRSTTEWIDVDNYVAVGQTIVYQGTDPTKKEPVFEAADGTDTIVDKEKGLIYGLEEGLYDLEGFVKYQGGELRYIESENGFGTGTVVNFIVNGQVYESYTIIVFGDLSGDGVIDTFDTVLLAEISNFDREIEEGSAIAIAADIANNDGVADTYDLSKLYAVVNHDTTISQIPAIA